MVKLSKKIIAIETSHDDTSVVVYENRKILKEISYTQTDFHKKFGGTVPEYASRMHLENLQKSLAQLTKADLANVDFVAYTNEPGLIGSLHMGKLFAKALAISLHVPAKPINHMHGHIFAAAFDHDIDFPAVALIVSGGHSQLWHVKGFHDMTIIGETKDDSVGEVYDKIARKLSIGFPGGPIIDKLSATGENRYDFSLKDDGSYNFSFSGLKTKVINKINQLKMKNIENINGDISCSFQEAIIKILKSKTLRAITEYKPKSIILGGGVSANSRLRQEFASWHSNALIPSMRYTTDNAMMIAITADLKEQNDK